MRIKQIFCTDAHRFFSLNIHCFIFRCLDANLKACVGYRTMEVLLKLIENYLRAFQMKKSDHLTIRDHNQRLVLQALFNADETSRAQLAIDLNLNKSTISSIYRDLDEKGFIESLGDGETSETGGRKAKLIRFNRRYGYVISFDMGRHHLRTALVQVGGAVIMKQNTAVDGMSVLQVTELMISQIKKYKNNKNGTLNGLMGISVGIHGVVENNKVQYSPFFDYSQLDMAVELENVSGVRVVLENEANFAATYMRDYHDYRKSDHYNNMVVLNIHYGIGAGIIINGELYRGIQGRTGEIGRSVIETSTGETVRIEDLYSEDAMLRRTAERTGLIVQDRDRFIQLRKEQPETVSLLLDKWVRGISRVAFNLVQTLAPEALFIHSRFIAEMPDLLERVIVAYQMLNPINQSEILFANHSVYDATLLGGASSIAREVLDLDGLSLSFRL